VATRLIFPIPGDMITPEHIMFKTIREVARPRLRSCLRASPGRWSRGQGACSGGSSTRCSPLGWPLKAVTASRTRRSAMLTFTSSGRRTSRGRTGRPTYGAPPGADHRLDDIHEIRELVAGRIERRWSDRTIPLSTAVRLFGVGWFMLCARVGGATGHVIVGVLLGQHMSMRTLFIGPPRHWPRRHE
jgi:hypothetical protein